MTSQKIDIEEQLRGLKKNTEKLRMLKSHFDQGQIENDPPKFLALAKRGLEIALRTRNKRLTAFFSLALAEAFKAQWKYEEAHEYLKMAEQEFLRLNNEKYYHKTQRVYAEYCRFIGRYDEAIAICNENIKFLEQQPEKDIAEYIENQQIRALAYDDLGVYASALEFLYKCISLCEADSEGTLKRHYCKTLMYFGIVYFHMKQMDRSLEFHEKALEFKEHISQRSLVAIYVNLANVYNENTPGNYRKALDYYYRALAILEEVSGDKDALPQLLMNIGFAHYKLQQFDKALDYYNRALEIAKALPSFHILAQLLYVNIGKTYFSQGYTGKALSNFDVAREYAEKMDAKRSLVDIHEEYANLYEATGDLEKAFQHFKEHTRLKEDLYGQQKQIAIGAIERRVEIERREKQDQIHQLEMKHLKSEMNHKTKEIELQTLYLCQKNEVLGKLREYLEHVGDEPEVTKETIVNDVLEHIMEGIDVDNNWHRFEIQFRKIYSQFIDQILMKNPALTPTEIKICALLRMRLSAKEIANFLFLSVHTVFTHTKRIRRKLALPARTSLTSYLASL